MYCNGHYFGTRIFNVSNVNGYNRIYSKIIRIKRKEGNYMNHFIQFLEEEDGIGVVELILILVGIFTPYYGVDIRCMA